MLFIGLLLFVSLVVIHEFGHFIAARRNGVEVEEFGIGFPPRLWKRRLKNKTLFTLNLLPLGGFVKLKGEHDADSEKGSYGSASLWAKTKIILAGVVMNFLIAFILFTLLALVGMPKLFDNQFTVASNSNIIRNDVLVGQVEAASPADKAGIKQKDVLVAIISGDGSKTDITTASALPNVTEKYNGQKVTVELKRDGKSQSVTASLRSSEEVEKSKSTDSPKGYLGVVPAEFTLQKYTWSSPIVGLGVTAQLTQMTLKGLGSMIASIFSGKVKQATSQVAGPVGIFVIIKDGSSLGIRFVLMIMAVISLTLAIMNALPIPALDGGRLFVTYLFRLLKKELTPKLEDLIHGLGFAALMLLFILITIVDIKRFF